MEKILEQNGLILEVDYQADLLDMIDYLYYLEDGEYVIAMTNHDAIAIADAIYDSLGLGWLLYPKNKPKVSGEYLVSIEYSQGRRAVKSDHYHNDTENWDKYRVVYAFRPLPEPYGGEDE